MRFVWIENKSSSVNPVFYMVSDRFAKHVEELCVKHEKKRGEKDELDTGFR